MKPTSWLTRTVAALAAAVTAASVAVAFGGAAAAATPQYVPAACNALTAAQRSAAVPVARCFAVGVADGAGRPAVRSAAAGPPSTALGPQQIRSAYQLPDAGAGMTVAIVDAYGYGSAEADLGVFRSYYGLPPCTTDNGCFTKLDQRGGTNFPPEDGGWSVETALDLDAVSSACPKCKLLLVEGDTADLGDLGEAVDTAASLGAVAISNSYGVDGEISVEQDYDKYYDHPGVAVTVSTGDSGNVQSWPATSPVVTGVGGTRLTPDGSARGWAETAWDSGGSGCSLYEPRPDYQAGLATACPNNKASADISADADPASGLAVYNTLGQSGWAQWGGTSLASPLVAAMYALAGTPTPGTYPVTYPYRDTADLNDVTQGANGSCGNVLCNAGPGWDGPTGFGSPKGIGALTLGKTGEIVGKATDNGNGTGLAGVAITATAANGDRFSATSQTDGSYDLHAPEGTYDVTATKFGYGDAKVTGVQVTAGGKVTENFALTAKPTRTISGRVTDGSGHGYPLRAKITIDGYPNGAVYSDPFTGRYSVALPNGTSYKLHVAAADIPGYSTQDTTVALGDQNVTQDVPLKVDASTCTAPGYAYHEDGATEAFANWSGKTTKDGWTVTDGVGNGQTWGFDNVGGWAPPPGGDGYFADVDSDFYGEGGQQDTSLVSPVVDLTGRADPEIGFDTTYIGFPGQTGSVDLSLDGGQTWSTVQQMNGTIDHVDIPIPQAAGKSSVRIRFHYTAGWSRRWEVDNVLVGSRACAPLPGGLVAGVVTDANTGQPLTGATVTSDASKTDFGVSAATPDDANIGDGYYWLFSSHTGSVGFTTTDGRYTPNDKTITVRPDGVQEADVALNAGRLTVDKSAVSVSEELGASKDQTVTFGNTGKSPVHVHLGETDGGVTPAKAAGAPKTVVKASTSIAASAGGAATSGGVHPTLRQAAPAAGPWTDVADFPTAVMDDAVANHNGKIYAVGGTDGFAPSNGAYVYDPTNNAWSALAPLPEAVSAAKAEFVGDTLFVVGGWNQLGSTSAHTYAYNVTANSWSRVADLPAAVSAAGSAVVAGQLYVVGGCTTSQCTPMSTAVYSYDPGNNSWTKQPDYPTGAAFIACGGVAASVVCAGGIGNGALTKTYSYTPGSGSWTQRADLPVDAWGAAAASANGHLEVVGGAVNNGAEISNQGYEYDPAGNAWTALPNANNATYRGGATCGIYKVGGSTGGFNAAQFTENLPGYGDCGGDVPWLSENKTDFDVAPGKTVSVRITADSSAVSQPGTYQGLLFVSTDSPYASVGPVKVTMTATPPAAWGKIAGTVTSSSGTPIAGATVAVCTMYNTKTGTCGPTTFTLKTDGQGKYQLWLNKGFNPLQVIFAKDGFTPVMKIVKVQKGETVTTDVTLAGNSAFGTARTQQYLNDTIKRSS
ncbi:carboxypeptidase regulatory-like domain-containing protein [Kutzneria buriramensis]|uniref:Galactose oxidase-like protein n=1 Tax=Kutzneria buriramensis TaxID=1045776 RepID=A0A3E0HKL3_9PSEU|nr:carboxypeptidase regulatory-like domain-containing protein [Kutzneria buriramensis]REH46999.1 galactose oxidase-like protein [Kutzneria buriramensis]